MATAELAKINMIERQIRPWEVLDNRVLSVIERVNREDFVREPFKGLAYADYQIPVADGVRMLPPTVEGRMLQALLIQPGDRVLEVGCGSGYTGACLAQLASSVTSIDTDAGLIEFARGNLERCGIDKVVLEQKTLAQIDETQAYDAIAVTASLPAVPENLRQALTPGGRLFIVVGHSPVMQALLITRVAESEWSTQSLFETDLPRLRT